MRPDWPGLASSGVAMIRRASLPVARGDSEYTASRREYQSRLPALEYPGHHAVKRVTTVGTFRFKTKLLFIANALRGYRIGLDEEADGVWSIFFGDILVAMLDERGCIIRE